MRVRDLFVQVFDDVSAVVEDRAVVEHERRHLHHRAEWADEFLLLIGVIGQMLERYAKQLQRDADPAGIAGKPWTDKFHH